MRAPVSAFHAFLLLVSLAGVAAAQGTTFVRVRVVDSAGAPIPNAEVSVLRGLSTAVEAGSTDRAGQRTFAVPQGFDYQVIARRIGFRRGTHFFTAARDTLAVRIVLGVPPQALPAVDITAQQDMKRRAYRVDADEIAASKRPIIDGLDILTKLRPDIIYSRVPKCAARYVWVNGTRIIYPPINEALAIKSSQQRRAARSAPHMGPTGLATVNLTVQSVMASIRPEHIEEINFADCNDTSVDKVNGNSALFIALKPGVAFKPGIGSFVADAAAAPTTVNVETEPVGAAHAPDRPASYRARLLGVFDGTTGEPVVGAQVVDSTTGTFALTTSTGTVSLVFLPEGVSTVRITKPGYSELRLPVSISPRDSVPLTLMLSRPK